MLTFLKALLSFAIALVVTQICASIVASQFVLAELTAMNVSITWGTRLEVTITDLWRSAPSYWLLTVPALLLSIIVAAILKSRVSVTAHAVLFILCSGVLLGLLNILLAYLFGMSVIAGLRGWGVLGLIVAGSIGGWFYQLLMRGGKSYE